ncbi:MAG: alpha/beta hydrolase [Sphingomicrobium sp.]
MPSFSKTILIAAALLISSSVHAQAPKVTAGKPTIILVHGAFAESASWNAVAGRLLHDGYKVLAAANPLRSVKTDAAYLTSIIQSENGPVVLVGHSYGGAVISAAADPRGQVKALVFVSGLAPDIGESGGTIGAKFPEGTLGQALAPPVLLADGSKDLYILQAKFWKQFAADVPESDAAEMAATQRPVTEAALNEPATFAAWKTVPSWFIYGSLDKNIPPSAHAFMAQRAHARETIEVKGSSHVVMISHRAEVAALIERAAIAK